MLFPSILQRKNISYVETFFKIKSCLKLIYAVWCVPPFAIFKQPAIIRIYSVTAALTANTGSNFYKWNITIGWCFLFIVEMNMLYEYAGMLISETIFYNKLCSV